MAQETGSLGIIVENEVPAEAVDERGKAGGNNQRTE